MSVFLPSHLPIWFYNLCQAGGAGGTDETGTNKDTHQLPVISMRTLIDVPASFPCQFSAMGRG